MNRLRPYMVRMGLFLAVVAGIGVLLGPALAAAFMANAVLNGVILGVLLVGIAYVIRQTLRLAPDLGWVGAMRAETAPEARPTPKLTAPLARVLAGREEAATLTPMTVRSLLDGVAARLEESRELSRYFIQLLIFLGLLGTFWGLLQTVQQVGTVVGGLEVGTGDELAAFGRLQAGLEGPLSAMGTAFSSSLFGLAGSLVLGFLDLQAGQAQNRFFVDLEDWLSSSTRLMPAGAGGHDEEEGRRLDALTDVLDRMTATLDQLREATGEAEHARRLTSANLNTLVERMEQLGTAMELDQALKTGLADTQRDLQGLMERLAEAGDAGRFGVDEATRQHLRNIDLYLARLVESSETTNPQKLDELTAEFRRMSRGIGILLTSGPGHAPAPKPGKANETGGETA